MNNKRKKKNIEATFVCRDGEVFCLIPLWECNEGRARAATFIKVSLILVVLGRKPPGE
jgi:hypothetical protein